MYQYQVVGIVMIIIVIIIVMIVVIIDVHSYMTVNHLIKTIKQIGETVEISADKENDRQDTDSQDVCMALDENKIMNSEIKPSLAVNVQYDKKTNRLSVDTKILVSFLLVILMHQLSVTTNSMWFMWVRDKLSVVHDKMMRKHNEKEDNNGENI